jgi:hypothetical protein
MAQINDSLAYWNILNLYQSEPIPETCKFQDKKTAWHQPYLKNQLCSNKAKLLGDFMVDFFNNNDTRTALHVRKDVGDWKPCLGGSNGENANYTIDPNGT